MNPATDSTSAGEPLTSEHHRQYLLATQRGGKIRAAAKRAWFNGWVTGFFALASAPFAPFSLSGFLVTLGLAVVTYNEFCGRRMLLAFNPHAAKLLGWNQIGFLAIIVGYSLWMIVEGYRGPSPLEVELKANPDLQALLGSPDELQQLYQFFVLAVYGTCIVLSGLFQGLNAWYYFARRQYLIAYLKETPQWILQLQRASLTS